MRRQQPRDAATTEAATNLSARSQACRALLFRMERGPLGLDCFTNSLMRSIVSWSEIDLDKRVVRDFAVEFHTLVTHFRFRGYHQLLLIRRRNRSFVQDQVRQTRPVPLDGSVHFVCMDWRHMDSVSAVSSSVYGELLNLCIWNKSNAGMGSLYRPKHELVFVYRVGTASHLNMVELGRHGRNRTNVWDHASVNSMRGSRREDLALHPTVKPTGLVADAIQDVTRRGDLVLDLFLGSGTTLLAAERTGRRFRGLDIDPAYVDVAIERWSARTGLEPQLEEPKS
jgi:DNA methylase